MSGDVFDELRAAFAAGDSGRVSEVLEELGWRLRLLIAADLLEGGAVSVGESR